jgi:hypothetical protein
VILCTNPDLILTPGKIRSQMNTLFRGLREEQLRDTNAIFFDRKAYDTLVLELELFGEGSHWNVIQNQDHYIVTDAAREIFIGEFVPPSGTGKDMAEGRLRGI